MDASHCPYAPTVLCAAAAVTVRPRLASTFGLFMICRLRAWDLLGSMYLGQHAVDLGGDNRKLGPLHFYMSPVPHTFSRN